jgi:hypothetical protein
MLKRRHPGHDSVTTTEYTCVQSLWSFGFHQDLCIELKVKCTLVQALRLCTGRTAHKGSRGIAVLFLDHGTRRGWGVGVTPSLSPNPPEKNGTNCTESWVGRSGQVRKISPPPGFDPRTVQPIASHYTDCTTGPYPLHSTTQIQDGSSKTPALRTKYKLFI